MPGGCAGGGCPQQSPIRSSPGASLGDFSNRTRGPEKALATPGTSPKADVPLTPSRVGSTSTPAKTLVLGGHSPALQDSYIIS